MKVYSPAEVAAQLKVKDSTLRKYSILLEKAGVTFSRNNQNQRWYSDRDVMMLRKLVTLKNNGDMSLKDCADAVFLWANGNDVTEPLTDMHNVPERYESDLTDIKKLVQEQNGLIQELTKRLDQQQEYIDKRLNERDTSLMHTLEELLESKKQIAAAEIKKKRWWKF